MGRSPSSDRGIEIRKGIPMLQSNSAGASNCSSSSPEPAVAGWRVDHCANGERARAGRPLVRPAVRTPMMRPIPTPSPTQGPHRHHPGHRHAALPAQQPAGACRCRRIGSRFATFACQLVAHLLKERGCGGRGSKESTGLCHRGWGLKAEGLGGNGAVKERDEGKGGGLTSPSQRP
jgi:hypothetical protein